MDAATVPPEHWRAFGILAFTMGPFDNDTEAMILSGCGRT